MKYLAAIMLLALSALGAKAEIQLMECSPGKSVTRIILIDTVKKEATHWAKLSPTVTNGPFGPEKADISNERVAWINVKTTGKLMSTTRYVIDRINKSMTIDISYNYDQDPWHEDAVCK
ncbi:hypothetical protein [Bradyrhizobium genosp. P]|uniref:hypothetical protein n=1 Tax=Bradyrhizobium genosp. P TaxID=83641 RepID=UPI003CF23AE3